MAGASPIASPLVPHEAQDAARSRSERRHRPEATAGLSRSRSVRGRAAGPRSARLRSLHPAPRRAAAAAAEAAQARPGALATPPGATYWSDARVVDRRSAGLASVCDAPAPLAERARLAQRAPLPERARLAQRAPLPERARLAQRAPLGLRDLDREPLRITRRGLLVLGGALLAAIIGLLAIAQASAPADPSAPASAPAVVTVHDGDTLWSIAAAVAPQRDPREVVSDLRRINSLVSVDLQPGQLIRTR